MEPVTIDSHYIHIGFYKQSCISIYHTLQSKVAVVQEHKKNNSNLL